MSPGAQNMITGPDTHGTAENESEQAKHENGTGWPQYRQKRERKRKHKKGTRRPRYRRKRVRERKT
jgi:hypothetical protein